MNTTQASRLFGTLGANTRLDIFRLLVKQGGQGMVAGDIAKALNVSPANLSFHLKELSHAGLVDVQQEGRFQRYRADLALMLDLVAFLTGRMLCARCAKQRLHASQFCRFAGKCRCPMLISFHTNPKK